MVIAKFDIPVERAIHTPHVKDILVVLMSEYQILMELCLCLHAHGQMSPISKILESGGACEKSIVVNT